MHIYGLTERGKRVARSISSPNNLHWKIIYYIDRVGQCTPEQIMDSTGASATDIGKSLRYLMRKKVIARIE
jgi:predicted HTH transcriptional regulator